MVICNINFNRLPKTELNWSERCGSKKKEIGKFYRCRVAKLDWGLVYREKICPG